MSAEAFFALRKEQHINTNAAALFTRAKAEGANILQPCRATQQCRHSSASKPGSGDIPKPCQHSGAKQSSEYVPYNTIERTTGCCWAVVPTVFLQSRCESEDETRTYDMMRAMK